MGVESLEMEKMKKKDRSAWGITGSGDRLAETIEVMKKIQMEYQGFRNQFS